MQSLPFGSSVPVGDISVLAASPFQESLDELRRICDRWKWKLYPARDHHTALRLVRQHRIPVVLCDQGLPNNGWRVVLHELKEVSHNARFIVFSRSADHRLWMDVLEQGGYDVLVTPLDDDEVSRVVFLAWHAVRHDPSCEVPAATAVA